MRVNVNGIVFNSYEADTEGVQWYVTGLTGWDSPDLRQAQVEPTSRHGGVVARSLLAPRSMVLSGIVKAPSLEAFYAAQQRLRLVTRDGYNPFPFRVTEDIERECGVVRHGGVRMRLAGLRAFEFELPVTAMDPLKYPVTPPSPVTIDPGQSAVITNSGDYNTERYTITANGEGKVHVVNEEVEGRGLLTDQDPEEGTIFDSLARTVTTPDGNPAYSVLAAASDWWGLLPGENTIRNDGEVSVTINYYDAWL